MRTESRQNDLQLRHELRPGDIGRLITLHGEAYAALPGFDLKFEAYVARTFAEFGIEADFDGRIWMLERERRLLGSSAIVHRDRGMMQLRWVVLAPELRGGGHGRLLVERAVDYCRDRKARRIVLETTDGLDASAGLYRSLGFEIEEERVVELWNGVRPLIRMALEL